MTGAARPRKPRRMRSAPAGAKEAVLAAALVQAPFEGFTDRTLQRAAADAGVARNQVARLFPEGPLSL
ncbi:MAG TPA: hypothetical protein VIY09_02080, partial [Rhizomicrobium sp.]